jgi:hypothetical protein
MKSILLEMLAEIEDLRANLAVIAAYASRPPTVAAARDAKSLAMQQHKEAFALLRAKIEKLPLE